MVFVVTFLLYWWTLCPGLYVGDSGELLAAAHCLGIPHPTGYPLYLLVVKGFASLVPGSFAYGANLLSAVCAAAAAQLTARALEQLLGRPWVARAAALSLALVEPIWSQATIARTYPLALLFSAWMLRYAVAWWRDPQPKWWWRHNLVLGFGLANHPMVIAHLPALLGLVVLRKAATLRDVRGVALAAAAVLPGLALYAYLPLRAAADPVIEYQAPLEEGGRTVLTELTEFRALKSYLLREFHHDHRWAEGAGDYAVIAGHHLGLAAVELAFVGALPLLLGVWVLWRRRDGLLAFAALLWLFTLIPLAWHGAWWDIFLYPRYMTTSWIAVALCVAVGLGRVVEWLEHRFPGRRALGHAAVAALPVVLLVMNYSRCDRREHTLADDYGRALFAEIPQGGQFGSAADNAIYPMMYLQVVEGLRPDVTIVNAVQIAGSEPDYELPMFSTDLSAGPFQARFPYGHRRGLNMAFAATGGLPMPITDLVAPDIAGLDEEIPLDAISASVVAQIHADLAHAFLVRDEIEVCREHLDRVAEIRAGRTWGAMRAAEHSLNLARRTLRGVIARTAGVSLDDAEADLARAARLLSNALRDGDGRDPGPAEARRFVRGYELVRDALGARDRGDLERALELMGQAARTLPRQTWVQDYYLGVLRNRGLVEDAEAHQRWLAEELRRRP